MKIGHRIIPPPSSRRLKVEKYTYPMTRNTSNDPLISIIMPAYNAETTILESISSVQNQSYRQWELIVMDDGSTDNTFNICQEVSQLDSRVKVHRVPVNIGLPGAIRNIGCKLAQGKYLAFLDSDDIWFKFKLHRQVQVILEQPHVNILVHSALFEFTESSKFLFGLLHLSNPYKRITTFESLRLRNRIQCSSVLMSKEPFERVGGFSEDPRWKSIEDYELWLRLSELVPIKFIVEIQGLYRRTQGSLSATSSTQSRLNTLQLENRISLQTRLTMKNRILTKAFGLPIAVIYFLVIAPIRRIFGFRTLVF